MSRWTENQNPDEPTLEYHQWVTSACWRPEGRTQDTAIVKVDKTSNDARETVAALRRNHGHLPEFTILVEVLTMRATVEAGKRVVRCVGRRDQSVRSEPVRNPAWVNQ